MFFCTRGSRDADTERLPVSYSFPTPGTKVILESFKPPGVAISRDLQRPQRYAGRGPGPLKPRYSVIRRPKLTVSSADASVRNTATFLRSSSFCESSVGQAVAVGLPLWWAALPRTRKGFEVHRRGVPHSNNLAPRSAKSQQPYYPSLPTCVKGS